MKIEFQIAKRIHFSDQREGMRMSKPAVRVAVGGIALGVAVMIITLSVVFGFKETIREKVTGFGGHIQIVNFDNNNTYEMQPIHLSNSLLNSIRITPNVASAEPFCTKPGIIKTGNAFQGIVLKGTERRDSTDTFFQQNLIAGRLPQNPKEVLISASLGRKLQLGLDSSFYCYFVEEQVRVRKLTICGIYDTQFADYDNLFIIGDISVIRQLNQWAEDQASGIEIRVSDFSKLQEVDDRLYFLTANRLDEDGNAYYTQTIEEQNPTIFSWLALLDMNVIVIILLMLAVSGINIISGLIILILNSIQMIGILKALGADNRFIRKIFLTEAGFLISKGMLWGNLLGIGLCAIQYFLHVVPLDPASYYVSYAPISWTWGAWILLNAGTMLLTMLILVIPSSIVSKISPARVMHFE